MYGIHYASVYLVSLSNVFIVEALFNGHSLLLWFSFLDLTFILEAYAN